MTTYRKGDRVRLVHGFTMRTHDGPLRAEAGDLATVDADTEGPGVRAWLDRPTYNNDLEEGGFELIGERWSPEQRAVMGILEDGTVKTTELAVEKTAAAGFSFFEAESAIYVLNRMGVTAPDYSRGWPYPLSLTDYGRTALAEILH